MDDSIPVCEPNLTNKELKYVMSAIKSTWISSKGEYLEKFEQLFSDYLGVENAIAVSNGTVALHLALIALNIGTGDEVIVPNLTYIATANAVTYTGATPIFADSEEDTWNISPDSIKRLINKKTKAIICVHIYGNPCDMDEIIKIAKTYNLFVIEDTAEALGSKYKEKKTGSFGDISTFSFYANKTITTGEGGMIVTNNKDLADRVKLFRGQGMDLHKRYWFNLVGYNYRLTNMQAAVGCAQLERIDELINQKRENAKLYNKLLKSATNFSLHNEKKGNFNTYWMYSIILKNSNRQKRENFREILKSKGIETRPFFYLMTEMPPYISHKSDYCKVSLELSCAGINLPSSTTLKKEQIEYICETIKQINLT